MLKRANCCALYLVLLAAALGPVTASALTDPTRPPNTASYADNRAYPGAAGWILNSTLVAADRRVAVINGKHVSEGETIDNATVVSIRKLDVLVESGGKQIVLKLLPDIVNTQP